MPFLRIRGKLLQQKRVYAYQRRLLQEERQRKLQENAQRLAMLSAQISQQVRALSAGTLPVDLAKKAAEAQKVAKQLEKLTKE